MKTITEISSIIHRNFSCNWEKADKIAELIYEPVHPSLMNDHAQSRAIEFVLWCNEMRKQNLHQGKYDETGEYIHTTTSELYELFIKEQSNPHL